MVLSWPGAVEYVRWHLETTRWSRRSRDIPPAAATKMAEKMDQLRQSDSAAFDDFIAERMEKMLESLSDQMERKFRDEPTEPGVPPPR